MSPPYRAVIFDLWNTLIEVDEGYSPYPRVVRLLNLESEHIFRTAMRAEWMTRTGVSTDQFINRFCDRASIPCTREIREEFSRIWAEYLSHVGFLPEALSVLQTLRRAKISVAIVTNTVEPSLAVLPRLGISELADVVVGSPHCGYLKPDPRIFRVALNKLDTAPEEVLVVGDKLRTDILGGLILGTASALYDRRFAQMQKNARIPVTAIIPCLGDVLTLCGLQPLDAGAEDGS